MEILTQNSLFTDLTTIVGFNDDFLLAKGYVKGSWEDDKTLFSTSTNSGFEIHVVDNSEIWIERYGKLSLLKQVNTCADLLTLEMLLG